MTIYQIDCCALFKLDYMIFHRDSVYSISAPAKNHEICSSYMNLRLFAFKIIIISHTHLCRLFQSYAIMLSCFLLRLYALCNVFLYFRLGTCWLLFMHMHLLILFGTLFQFIFLGFRLEFANTRYLLLIS